MDWFARNLLHWFQLHGRHDLPWQRPRQPYGVWVSEIMLQQTQVATVLPYYQRFMARFPTIEQLAQAEQDEVLHLWTGLGYYARARNLHHSAKLVMTEFKGQLPASARELETLPGIGRSTANAIAAQCHNERAPILDGNVKRVLARFHAIPGHPSRAQTSKRLWHFADSHTPSTRLPDYTQAVMDLGATICTRSKPDCHQCPVQGRCEAYATDTMPKYPGKKEKKALPVRRARFFLIQGPDGACLLEQRPQPGLWGGLWTPPERDTQTEAAELCRQHGIAPEDIQTTTTEPEFRHTFSHYHLDIEPVHVQLAKTPLMVADRPDVRWIRPGTNEPIGLAAPAVKLLTSIKVL